MVRPTKKQIMAAANTVITFDAMNPFVKNKKFCCTALPNAAEFELFYNYPQDVLELDQDGCLVNARVGWFGHISDTNQLARSLALLLYAEARKDVLLDYAN